MSCSPPIESIPCQVWGGTQVHIQPWITETTLPPATPTPFAHSVWTNRPLKGLWICKSIWNHEPWSRKRGKGRGERRHDQPLLCEVHLSSGLGKALLVFASVAWTRKCWANCKALCKCSHDHAVSSRVKFVSFSSLPFSTKSIPKGLAQNSSFPLFVHFFWSLFCLLLQGCEIELLIDGC